MHDIQVHGTNHTKTYTREFRCYFVRGGHQYILQVVDLPICKLEIDTHSAKCRNAAFSGS